MNARTVNILLLAICLGLLGTLALTVQLLSKRNGLTEAQLDPMVVTNTVTQTEILVRKINPSNILARLAERTLSWSSIESTNYQVYMFKLRAFGCPDETIRDILLTDIAKHYNRRRAVLWRSELSGAWNPATWDDSYGVPSELAEPLKGLEQERDELVTELLGVDFETEMAKYWGGGTDHEELLVGFLPEEKRASVLLVEERYRELEEEIFARSKGVFLAADEMALRELERQKEQELGAVLTAEELESYQLRNSRVAVELRSELSAFAPSEEEFRSMVDLRKVYEASFDGAFDLSDPAAMEVKARAEVEARRAFDEEARKVLGEERYGEYTRSLDDDYRQLIQLGERLDLPEKVAGRVYEMKETAQQQKLRVESDPGLTPEQRQLAMVGIALEVERSVVAEMGVENFEIYRSAGAGWLDALRGSDGLTSGLEAIQPPPLPPLP